ncbi:MAG: hypothetical protein V8Q40_02705 [Anaerosacchariphilus sp.]
MRKRIYNWLTAFDDNEGNYRLTENIDVAGFQDRQCAFIPYVENAQIRNLTFENVILGKTDANNTNYMGIFGEPLYIHITSVYNQDNSKDLTSWYAL